MSLIENLPPSVRLGIVRKEDDEGSRAHVAAEPLPPAYRQCGVESRRDVEICEGAERDVWTPVE